jgi:hypothetical protein
MTRCFPVLFILLSAALASCALASCAPAPESVSEDEMAQFGLVVDEIVYYASQKKLVFDYRLENRFPGYEWISMDYDGTREFDIVDWITEPAASYFSVKSEANIAYLRDGMTLERTTRIAFDTETAAYLFAEDEHYDHYFAFAKVKIVTESLGISWKD